MKAYKHYNMAQSLVLEHVPIPEPADGEVLLQVEAAGLCHSDLHILGGSSASSAAILDYTMGHEICGRCVSNGANANADIGQLYCVLGTNPCARCEACQEGRENQCSSVRQLIGLGRDGGFAEYVVVPQTSLVPVPQNVSAAVAAVASDAVLTPYHALKNRAQVKAGQNLLIIGTGGLGLNAIEIGLLLGANVYATDMKSSAREEAQRVGATVVIPDELPKLAEKVPFHVILDAVGAESTFKSAQDLVAKNGTIMVMGLASSTSAQFQQMLLGLDASPGSVTFNTGIGVLKETTVKVTFWGTRQDLVEVLDYIAADKLRPLVKSAPLSELPKYIQAMQEGSLVGRVAFQPSSS